MGKTVQEIIDNAAPETKNVFYRLMECLLTDKKIKYTDLEYMRLCFSEDEKTVFFFIIAECINELKDKRNINE